MLIFTIMSNFFRFIFFKILLFFCNTKLYYNQKKEVK